MVNETAPETAKAVAAVLIYNGSRFPMSGASNLRCSASIVILLASLVFFVQAQTSPSAPQYRYLIQSYFKSKPDRAGEHVRYEREHRKPIYEQQVKNARAAYWKLFAVQFPGGEAGDYDFVTMVECAKASDLDAIVDLNLEEAIGDPKAELGKDTIPSKMVRQDLVAILESTENWSAPETRYLRVRFMKPREGKSTALASQERDIWKPYYEDSRIWFSGTARFTDTDGNTPPELAEKWEPKFRALPPASELRTVARDELWRLLEQTPGAR